jgi:hypothetical protein
MCDYAGPLAGAAFIALMVLGFALLGFGLSWLLNRGDTRRARSPDTPPEELLALAKHYPEVLQNPVLPLLSLENPALWAELRELCLRAAESRRKERRAFLRAFAPAMAIPVVMVLIIFLVWLIRRSRHQDAEDSTRARPALHSPWRRDG